MVRTRAPNQNKYMVPRHLGTVTITITIIIIITIRIMNIITTVTTTITNYQVRTIASYYYGAHLTTSSVRIHLFLWHPEELSRID